MLDEIDRSEQRFFFDSALGADTSRCSNQSRPAFMKKEKCHLMDVVVTQGWLSALIAFLDEHADVGAVAPRIMLYGSPDGINALEQNINVSGPGFNRRL